MTKLTLAILMAFATAGAASASTYLVVVPTPATSSSNPIQVTLTGGALPGASVGEQYSVDLIPLLTVLGDPHFDSSKVEWSLLQGPDGLSVVDGTLTGFLTEAGTHLVRVEASYRNKAGEAEYQIIATQITVALSGGALPEATKGELYSEPLSKYLHVAGDPAFKDADVSWSLASGSLPTGMTLTDGAITGTPTDKGDASFEILASYKDKSDQTVYTIKVGEVYLEVVQISASSNHTCAVTTAGAAKCWGQGTSGQLGNNRTSNSSVPVTVVGLNAGVASISLGGSYTCAVTTSGAAKCWGINENGQLGNNSKSRSSVPVDVVGLGSGVKSVSAGSSRSCAVTTSGAAKCWGRGRLGNNSSDDSSVPVDVTGLGSGVAGISVGGSHTCAVTTSGAAKCWGTGGRGQLGNNSTADSDVPVNVVGLSAGVASINLGADHTCALTTLGAVRCWGFNGSGQLGNNTLSNSAVPVDVIGLNSGVRSISAGGYNTCAVTTTGTAKCWGSGSYGQLGDGSTSGRSVPLDVVELESSVASISVAGNHICAVTTAGTARCIGNGSSGQLGNSRSINSLSYVDVLSD